MYGIFLILKTSQSKSEQRQSWHASSLAEFTFLIAFRLTFVKLWVGTLACEQFQWDRRRGGREEENVCQINFNCLEIYGEGNK